MCVTYNKQMSTITNFFSGGVTQYLSNDIVILVLLFIFFFVYALYLGKGAIISLILAFYPAQFFFEHFPFISQTMLLKGDSLLLVNKALVFMLFLVPLTILFGRYVFHDSGYGSMHYARMAGYALLCVVLVLVFSYSVISLDGVHNFSPAIDALFTGVDRIFYWNIAPIAILFFL